jgi:hypothetical protein
VLDAATIERDAVSLRMVEKDARFADAELVLGLLRTP